MIKLTVEDVVMMQENMNFILDLQLPAKTSYKVGSFVNAIKIKYTEFDVKRQELVRKYGQLDPDKAEIKVSVENMEKFSVELRGILSQETEIDIDLISLEDVGDMKVSAKNMAIFAKVFKE